MEIRLKDGESVEVYCSSGGGVALHLTAKVGGLQVTNVNARLRIAETRTDYSRKWLLSRDEEHGFDRT